MSSRHPPSNHRVLQDPWWLQYGTMAIAFSFLALFLGVPLVGVFYEALSWGVMAYWEALNEPDALHAIQLTLIVALLCIPMNLIFGICAAWAIAKFDFPGKSLLTTLIDLPFSISPVIVGVMFILVYGIYGWLGPWLMAWNVKIIFALPGIILVSLFITFPFVARELIPLMQAQGRDDEEAAVTLGASGLQTFWRVTLPNIKWGLLYGVVLSNARAMGEFGAVSVVSGHIRGETNTLPLHVEILYNEYQAVAAFAAASVLSFLALLTIAAKAVIEWHIRRERREIRLETFGSE